MRGIGSRLWGVVLLILAGIIVFSQINAPIMLNFWDGTIVFLAAIFIIGTVTGRSLKPLPFAAAFIYIVLRNHQMVTYMPTWVLIVAALLVSSAIGFLSPKKWFGRFHIEF